jgi:MerR family transcriptional regulator, light-induced transcriptional regulator
MSWVRQAVGVKETRRVHGASAAQSASWSIAGAAARVGVSVSTLRSWESRYGLAPTGRTAGGHRRYTMADVADLQRIQWLVRQGMPTAQAVSSAGGTADRVIPSPVPGLPEVDRLGGRLRAASLALDSATAIRTARAILTQRGGVRSWTQVFTPALQDAGEQWERTGGGVECEHLLSHAVLTALDRYTSERRAPKQASVLLAATPNEAHTLPLHAVAAGLAEQAIGCRTLDMLPVIALHSAVDLLAPGAVVLWARSKDTADVQLLVDLTHRTPLVCAAGPGWSEDVPEPAVATRDLPSTVDLLATWTRRQLESEVPQV